MSPLTLVALYALVALGIAYLTHQGFAWLVRRLTPVPRVPVLWAVMYLIPFAAVGQGQVLATLIVAADIRDLLGAAPPSGAVSLFCLLAAAGPTLRLFIRLAQTVRALEPPDTSCRWDGALPAKIEGPIDHHGNPEVVDR